MLGADFGLFEKSVLQTVALDRIIRDPEQPRRHFDPSKILELAESIKKHGQLVPLLVFPVGTSDQLQIVDGEMRWLALQLNKATEARIEKLPYRPNDTQLRLMQVITACKREDLTTIDQFRVYDEIQRLTGASPSELAKLLSVSPSSVTRVLSLRKLTAEELAMMEAGNVSSRDAYRLANLSAEDRSHILSGAANGVLDREELDRVDTVKLRGRKSQKPRCINLATSLGTLRFSAATEVSLTDLLTTLEAVTREIRKAKDQSFDIKTVEHVLAARAKAAGSEKGVT